MTATIHVLNLDQSTPLEQLQRLHPELVPATDNALVAAAKNIRIELKRAYPGVKFSVRSDRFAGGDAIDVDWTDGPTEKDIDKIIQKYKAGWFDGMDDLYNYAPTTWTRAFGDAKYIHGYRHYSDGMIELAIRMLATEYGDHSTPTVEDYKMGRAWNTTPMSGTRGELHWSWQSIIGRKLAETTEGT